MKFIRRLLYFLFSERIYFRIVSRCFFFFYFSGILKFSKKFNMHYFAANLIRKGDTIIDIGANLGYYSRIFAGATGREGSVWAVEPVPLYREILAVNTRKQPNIIILPYALGDTDSVEKMGIPGSQPYRHGLARIIKGDDKSAGTVTVEVKKPSDLFGDLERVDYIKCDIEGYEDRVMPGFIEIIRRDRPLIQIEIDPDNRQLINDLLSKEAYQAYTADRKYLRRVTESEKISSDIIYIHNDKKDKIRDLIN